MSNHDLPEDTYRELTRLMGKEDADIFIKTVQFNYKAVRMKIFRLKISAYTDKYKELVFFIGIATIFWIAWKLVKEYI
jgi:hypothetical protein